MVILSKGYKKPETGDFGDVWFPALEYNTERVNSHTHNGLDGEKISGIDLIAFSLVVQSSSFAQQPSGEWRATVTVPNGELVDSCVVTVKDPTTKDICFLKVEKLAPTQFYLYTNIVQNFEVYFGV